MTLEEFASSKGLTADLLRSFGVRADFDRIEIPYYDAHGDELPRFQVRYDNAKAWSWNKRNGAVTPYGLHRPVAYGELVMIVEGASDCWTLWSHNTPALGVPGATATGCLNAGQLGDVPEVVIVREPDEAGSRFPARVGRRLRETGFAGVLSVCTFEPHKDPRAALIAAPGAFDAFLEGVLKGRTVLAEERRGVLVPAVVSSGTMLHTVELVEWLVDGLLPLGGSMLLGAQKKVGKSTFLLYLALCVARGVPFLDRATKPVRVLYVSIDEPKAITRERAAALGLTDADQVDWILDRRPPPDWQKWLRDLIAASHYGLLVIDTLAKLLDIAEINSYGEWNHKLLPLHALAEEFKITWAGSAHNSKASAGGSNAVAGSTAITANVDTIMIEQKLPGGVRTIETEQRHGLDIEPTILTMAENYALTLGDEQWRARLKEVAAKVFFLMGDGRERRADDILNELHLRRADLFTALDRLIADGQIIKPAPGRYQVPATLVPPRNGELCRFFIGNPRLGMPCERCGVAWSEHP